MTLPLLVAKVGVALLGGSVPVVGELALLRPSCNALPDVLSGSDTDSRVTATIGVAPLVPVALGMDSLLVLDSSTRLASVRCCAARVCS